MRAMVFTGPGVVEMLEVPDPVPGPDELLLNVALVGICGSELHGIVQPGFRQPPLIMGHEFAATTSDGRRVTVNPIVHCGSCDRCRAGADNLCRGREILGVHRPGAFAEHVAVPAALVHELPPGLSMESAAMVEPLANAVHAWRVAGSPPDSQIGIIGAGPIGLASLLVARVEGAKSITVADLSPDRQRMARKLGADKVADALDGEYDVVIDAVGLRATRRASVEHLRSGGVSVWLGLIEPDPGFDALSLVRAEKTVRGSFAYTDPEFSAAIELAEEVDLEWAEVFPLEQGASVFTELMHGRSDVVKALLRPGHA